MPAERTSVVWRLHTTPFTRSRQDRKCTEHPPGYSPSLIPSPESGPKNVPACSPSSSPPKAPTALPSHRTAAPALFSPTTHAERRFWEFFTAHIRNPNTRLAYLTAAQRFATWCERRGLALDQVEPMVVAAYIEQLSGTLAAPSVKQHLAALRMLFDWLVVGQILPFNPASSVRGPKHVVKSGKTPVLSAAETRALLDRIDVATLAGLRDRALLGVLVYSFARVTAAVSMRVADYYTQGPRALLLLAPTSRGRSTVAAPKQRSDRIARGSLRTGANFACTERRAQKTFA